jgi:neutral ceramidase
VLKNEIAYMDARLAEAVPEEAFIDEHLAKDSDSFAMPPADPRLQIVAFENEGGESLGSFVRFAMHVVTCNGNDFYSADFPHFLRQRIESALGGIAIYLNGPCGNIAPAIRDKKTGAERAYGYLLADAALAALKGSRPEPLVTLMDVSRQVVLPVRADFPPDDAATDARIAACRPLLDNPALSLAERRKLSEQIRFLDTSKLLRTKWGMPDWPEEAGGKPTLALSMGLLRLNELTVLALPAESFMETGQEAVAGLDSSMIIVATEHGRTALYMPPPAEWDLGGYQWTCSAIARDGEPVLRRAAEKLLREHLSGQAGKR